MDTTTSTLNFEYGMVTDLDAKQLFTEQDQACFDEIRQILKKHQALDRFGVTLLDNEVLPDDAMRLETNSIQDRTLITQIIKKEVTQGKSIETNWTLNTLEAVAACVVGCVEGPSGHITNNHGSSGNDPGPSPNNPNNQ